MESEAESTVESTSMAGEIMHRMGLRSVIVVSDGYHIYRVKTNAAGARPERLWFAAQRAAPRPASRALELP